ncbi:MAG: ChbG/HpnK family deacetylase, partial [Flavobacteriaceae bacterium]
HLDCHMYSVAVHADLITVYKKLGKKYGLPVLLSKELIDFVGYGAESALEKNDILVDKIFVGEYSYFKDRKLKQFYGDVLDNLQAGLNIILIHPAFDTPEMQSITVNHPNFGSEWRQIDFDYFTSEACRSKIKANDIQLVTWKDYISLQKTMKND